MSILTQFSKFISAVPTHIAVAPGEVIRITNKPQYHNYLLGHLTGIRRVAILPGALDGTTQFAAIRFPAISGEKVGLPLAQATRVQTILRRGLPAITQETTSAKLTAKFGEWSIPSYIERASSLESEEYNLWLFLKSPRMTNEVWLTIQSFLCGLGIGDAATVLPLPAHRQSEPILGDMIPLPFFPGVPDLFAGQACGGLNELRTGFLDMAADPPHMVTSLPPSCEHVSATAFKNLVEAVDIHALQALRQRATKTSHNSRDPLVGLDDGGDASGHLMMTVRVEIPELQNFLAAVSSQGEGLSTGEGPEESGTDESVLPLALRAKLDSWKRLKGDERIQAIRTHFSSDFLAVTREYQIPWLKRVAGEFNLIASELAKWARLGFRRLEMKDKPLLDILLLADDVGCTGTQRGRIIISWIKSNGGIFEMDDDCCVLRWDGAAYTVDPNPEFGLLLWELTGKGDSRLILDECWEGLINESLLIAKSGQPQPAKKARAKRRN